MPVTRNSLRVDPFINVRVDGYSLSDELTTTAAGT